MKKYFFKIILTFTVLCLGSQYLNASTDTIYYIGDENYPPFEYVNESGEPDGFNIRLMQKLAETVNNELTIELIPWHEVVDSMKWGTESYVTSMYLSDRREKLYLFTTPHNKVSQAMFTPQETDIKDFEDIKDKTILVEKDDIMHDFVQDIHLTGKVKTYDNYFEAFDALKDGKGDVVLCPKVQGNYILQKKDISGIKYQELPLPLLDYCFSISNNDKNLHAILNEGLLMLRQSGAYDTIYENWYSAYAQPDFIVFLKKWLLPAILILLGLLVLVLIWVYSLRQRVLRKTLALRLELHQRRLAEKNLKYAKEKAEESNKLKTAFLSNLNHEIRTPLNSIMGFSELLLENTGKDDPKKEQLEIIHKSSAQLLSIIEDMINMSKIEAGQVKVNNSKFRLHELLTDMQKMFKYRARYKELELILDLPDHAEDLWIKSDAGKLKQIITNLLNNAFKYTSKGEIRFGYKPENTFLEFFVADTGCGIPEDKQELIFERFVQANNDGLQTPYNGSGLGLSIAQAYVKMLGGEIHVKSKPGKGSTFYFTIQPEDIMKIENATEAREITNIEKLKGKRILIAEDISDNFIYIRESLKKYKVVCTHAINGQEAYDYVRQEDFDAVLMDLKMPVLNGYESLEKIKKLKPNLPIIALTAYAQENDKQQVLQAGFDAYLAKPVSRESIVNVLIETTSGK
ncbi:MAG: response regulator [Bacteroidota bacterium]